MPRQAFQYYVFAFADFVLSDKAIGDPDSASPFLRLLMAREERDTGSVAQIYSEFLPAIEHVASHQGAYDADRNIYGGWRGDVHLPQYFEPLHFGRKPRRLPSAGTCGAGDAQVVQGPAIGTPEVHGRQDASESDTASLT
jgi:hypothetical protein